MKILITTGLSGADIGGPFQYGPRLAEEFHNLGHKVKLVSYGKAEKFLPLGLRHLYFFLRIIPQCFWTDYILTLDTFSVGVPSVWAAKICGKKIVVRVGGDYLWSAYVNRTSDSVTLPGFYRQMPKLNMKERMIFSYIKRMIKKADYLAFNTEWQRDIWSRHYKIPREHSGVVRNFIPTKREANVPEDKNFLWAGRVIPEKNPEILRKLGIDIVTGESHDKVLEKIKSSYATASLAFTDICPNFILEGISFNKPFVMTKHTGLSELAPVGGIYVDPRNEGEIEESLEALRDENTYNKYVEELKSLNLRHSWNEMANELINIWKNL